MITIITGDTHTGKTTLGRRMMRETGVSVVSMDHIKMGLIRAGLVGASPTDPDASITAWLWPVIREMALTCHENGQSVIIEGCYVDFGDLRALPPGTRLVCLVMTEGYIREHIQAIRDHAHSAERRLHDLCLCGDELIAGNAQFGEAMDRAGLIATVIDRDWEADTRDLVINTL